MNDEDSFLFSKYSEYRKVLHGIEPCDEFVSHERFCFPKMIRLDGEFGIQQKVYRDLASDTARDLANGINHLIDLTKRLEAWLTVITGRDIGEKSRLLHEFVQDLTTMGLLSPYTLKSRFYFAIAHLCHQANGVRQGKEGKEWSDDFATLPEDWKICQETAIKHAERWHAWRKLNRNLNKVDAGDYKKATRDFRNKHTHRFTPRVELGITQTVVRVPEDGGRPSYVIEGVEPIELKIVVENLKKQNHWLSMSYQEFRNLIVEQSATVFGSDEIDNRENSIN